MDNGNVGNSGATAKRKVKWTPELHFKFMDAITILGGIHNTDAVPSQILELMNEPGLTRENVASHLQKYRKLKRTGSLRINKLARLDEQYNIRQRGQLEASLSYSSHHASSNGCHLGVSLFDQDESMFNPQNHPYWNASSEGSTIIQDCSSRLLSRSSNDSCCCLSSSSSDNYNASNFEGNYHQTEVSFVENENMYVEGSSYLTSKLGGYIFPPNEDNNSSYSPYCTQGMDQEIALHKQFEGEGENYNYYYPSPTYGLSRFDDNTIVQDNSGGNHHFVQIGNEYAMNYSYGSVEPEPWHDYPVLGSQPSLQCDDDEDFVQSLFA